MVELLKTSSLLSDISTGIYSQFHEWIEKKEVMMSDVINVFFVGLYYQRKFTSLTGMLEKMSLYMLTFYRMTVYCLIKFEWYETSPCQIVSLMVLFLISLDCVGY